MYAGSEAHSHQEEKLTACENHYGIHSSGGLSSQKEYSLQRKSSGSTKETNQQDNNSGQGAQYSLKLGVGGVRSFFPSVYFLHICIGSLDVLHILYWMSWYTLAKCLWWMSGCLTCLDVLFCMSVLNVFSDILKSYLYWMSVLNVSMSWMSGLYWMSCLYWMSVLNVCIECLYWMSWCLTCLDVLSVLHVRQSVLNFLMSWMSCLYCMSVLNVLMSWVSCLYYMSVLNVSMSWMSCLYWMSYQCLYWMSGYKRWGRVLLKFVLLTTKSLRMPKLCVCSDYFLDPFDDESPQDKTTREEEEKEQTELEEDEAVIWSSCGVGGGVVWRVSGGWYPCLPNEDIHLWWDNILRIPNTWPCVILFKFLWFFTFWYIVVWSNPGHTHSCPSQFWILRMYTSTFKLFASQKIKCTPLGVSSPIVTVTPPLLRPHLPVQLILWLCDSERLE